MPQNRIGFPGFISQKTIPWITGLMLMLFVVKMLGVPILISIEKFAQFHLDSQPAANTNQNVLGKTDILERHKHQSPVAYQKPTSPRVMVTNTMSSLPKLNTKFELDLHNRFASLQHLGSELLESNHTMAREPSRVAHSTLSNTSRVSRKRLCKKNDLMETCQDNLSISFEPSHQVLNHEDIIQSEPKQEKIPLDILVNKINCVDYVNCSQQNGTPFGFIPLTPLKIYTGEHTCSNVIHNIVDLHKTVKSSNLPNSWLAGFPCNLNLTFAIGGSTW